MILAPFLLSCSHTRGTDSHLDLTTYGPSGQVHLQFSAGIECKSPNSCDVLVSLRNAGRVPCSFGGRDALEELSVTVTRLEGQAWVPVQARRAPKSALQQYYRFITLRPKDTYSWRYPVHNFFDLQEGRYSLNVKLIVQINAHDIPLCTGPMSFGL